METPESIDSKALTALVNLAIETGANKLPTSLEFDAQSLMKFAEKISASVFQGTCHMIIHSIAEMVKEVGQEVALAKSVTEGELNGTSRTGSH